MRLVLFGYWMLFVFPVTEWNVDRHFGRLRGDKFRVQRRLRQVDMTAIGFFDLNRWHVVQDLGFHAAAIDEFDQRDHRCELNAHLRALIKNN